MAELEEFGKANDHTTSHPAEMSPFMVLSKPNPNYYQPGAPWKWRIPRYTRRLGAFPSLQSLNLVEKRICFCLC